MRLNEYWMIVKKFLLRILLIPILFLYGCACQRARQDFFVINVLDKETFDDCHIKGSINIPFDDLEKEISHFDKNDTIILYCTDYQCTASKYGVEMFKEAGFKNVYAYEAGMNEWYQQGLPVVGACKADYLKHKNEKIEIIEDNEIITTQNLKEKIKQKLAVSITS